MKRIVEEIKQPLYPRFMDTEINVTFVEEDMPPLEPRVFNETRDRTNEVLAENSEDVVSEKEEE